MLGLSTHPSQSHLQEMHCEVILVISKSKPSKLLLPYFYTEAVFFQAKNPNGIIYFIIFYQKNITDNSSLNTENRLRCFLKFFLCLESNYFGIIFLYEVMLLTQKLDVFVSFCFCLS